MKEHRLVVGVFAIRCDGRFGQEIHRLVDVASGSGLEEMVGQLGRVLFAAQRRVEALLEGQTGAAVQRDPGGRSQLFVEGLACQRVSKRIRAALGFDDGAGVERLGEEFERRFRALLFGKVQHRFEALDPEAAPDHRGGA